MDFMETIAIVVARIFALSMLDGLVLVAPVCQAAIDVVLK